MRGIDLVAAVTVLAEIGDLSRFQTPRELMGYPLRQISHPLSDQLERTRRLGGPTAI
jgi:hypothetical protein